MKTVLLLATLALAMLVTGQVSAETDNARLHRAARMTLQVTAVIAPRCEIATGPQVSVNCAKGVPHAIAAPALPNEAPNDATLSPPDRDPPIANVLQVYF